MRKLVGWIIWAVFLMLGIPWLTVTFAGDAGMAICFFLFFAINPLFAIISGIYAGSNLKARWVLPSATVGLFLAGTWLFFDMGEPAFLMYGCVYLVIGVLSMLICDLLKRNRGSRT